MAIEPTVDQWLERAHKAHDAWTKAEAKAETARTIRNGAIATAHRNGATQRQIAEALGVSQPAVASIIKRTPADD